MKLAICQLLIEGGEPYRNLERSETLIEEAKNKSCDLALLPETLDFAWTHPSGLEEADQIPGVFSNKLCSMAKKYQIFICAGLTEKTQEGNYNSCIFINSQGEILNIYRKINLLEVEFDYYQIGSSVNVITSPWGKLGINICSDNYLDALSISNVLGRMGARFILSPCSWTVDHYLTENDNNYQNKWKEPFSKIAMAFEIPVVGATGVGYIVGGPYEGKKMPGGSLVAYPDGSFSEAVFNEFSGSSLYVQLKTFKKMEYKGVQIGRKLNKMGLPY